MMTVLNGLFEVKNYIAKEKHPKFAVVTDACPVKWFVGDDLMELVGNAIGAGPLSTMKKTGECVKNVPVWLPDSNVAGTPLDVEVIASNQTEAKRKYDNIAKTIIASMHLSVFRHDGKGIGIQEFLEDWGLQGEQRQLAA